MLLLAHGLFLGIVVFLMAFLRRLFAGHTLITGKRVAIFALWMGITGILAGVGFFMNFDSLPPRILLVLLPSVAFLVYVSRTVLFRPFLDQTSGVALIGVQTFRVVMEIVLWLLSTQGVVATLMTWHGRNMDVFVGLSAPLMAYLLSKDVTRYRRLAIVWNLVSMGVLLVVLFHGIFSAPLPFQLFFTDPPNVFISTFPYIWLAAFVVPAAFFFHILSLRKLISTQGK